VVTRSKDKNIALNETSATELRAKGDMCEPGEQNAALFRDDIVGQPVFDFLGRHAEEVDESP
jgi:hypothetical protein